ncbi:class II aldolase and adducin N-terminal domain-containing protein [Limibaculum sp. FT325]|uniref:class II aldolase and adducin N-terminal domain-containing protein n=1 Tax=Thermohalobaculum sediminis TaxID=2939436 RepID=UPI0020C13F68|nr:class II aldolase and adducin N-terminal domain-containing protein [Limibaculum sediminis]MCL5775674.1 class II aldolase and adducin N-terminal domain-containing protein [Limibaculum sediminis]
MTATPLPRRETNIAHWAERCDLAAAFRWTARLGMHESVANHFSLAVNEDGTRFLINPNQRHFSRITASSLLEIDANDPATMERPDAPDPTAWGLHGAVHRLCPHARCAMHVHSIHATVLACLEDPSLPPLDQNAAMFFGKVAIDQHYGGLALGEEAERACEALADPAKTVLIMGNHGVMVVGDTVAQAFNRLYYFERAAETYIKALWTGRPLRVLSDEVAARTAAEMDDYDPFANNHLAELRAILDREAPDYAT